MSYSVWFYNSRDVKMIPLVDNRMIRVTIPKKNTEKLWRGYNVNICKDVESANEELKKILKNRKENLK